ncbi:Dibenzothiophene desulfurization enzyme C [compost metagenome]
MTIATAKVAASRDGLEICSKVFEVTGARATQASVGLDRHWRNLRTQSLHDPLDYKLHELGEWALNGQLPTPTFYS